MRTGLGAWRALAVLLFLGASVGACEGGSNVAANPPTRSTPTPVVVAGGAYTSQEHGYGLVFPEGWQVQAEEFNVDVIGMRPAVPESRFRANVNVVVQRVPATTLARWSRLARVQAANAVERYRSLSTGRTELGGQPAWQHRFTGVRDETPVTFWQVSTLRADRAYVVTAVSAADEFRESRDEFRRIIESFRFEERAPAT